MISKPEFRNSDQDRKIRIYRANPANPETDIRLKFEVQSLTIEMLDTMGARLVSEIINLVAEDTTGKRLMPIMDDTGKEICNVVITVGMKNENYDSRAILATEIWIDKIGNITTYGAQISVPNSMACQIVDETIPLRNLIDLPEGITVPIKVWSQMKGTDLIHGEFTRAYTGPEQVILIGSPAKRVSSVMQQYIRDNMS